MAIDNEPLLVLPSPISQEEPLLNFAIPPTPIPQQRSALMRSFISGESDDSSDGQESERHKLVVLRFLGRPYAAERTFWTRSWPLSFFLGGLLGLATVGFLGALHLILRLWFLSGAAPKDPGSWWWLGVTTGGGLTSGLVLLLPWSPRVARSTVLHDVNELKADVVQAPFLVFSSFVALATGAPLGPESAIGALGSSLAAFVSAHLQLDRRTEAGLVHCGLAGSLGGLFLSPVLGASLVHELSVAGRAPAALFLDGLTAAEIGVPREALPAHMDHDIMELVTLGGTAATSAFVVFQVLAPLVLSSEGDFYNQLIDLGQGDAFHLWHLPASILIGSFCGKAGLLALALIGLFQTIRESSCRFLHSKLKLPKWVGKLLFPTIAGILHGLLSVWNPLLGGSGMNFVQHVVHQEVTFRTVPRFMAMAACKVLSMSLCLGFGLVGGPIFPMLFVGLCLGMTMTPLLPITVAIPCCVCATVGSFLPTPLTLVFYTAFSMSLSAHQVGPVFVATFVAYGVVGGLGAVKNYGEKKIGFTSPEVDFSQWQPEERGGGDEDDNVFQYEALEDDGEEDEEELTREVRNAVYGHG